MDTIKVYSDDLITVGRAAKILKLSRVCVYKRIKQGKILSLKLGDITYIPKTEIERLKPKEASTVSS